MRRWTTQALALGISVGCYADSPAADDWVATVDGTPVSTTTGTEPSTTTEAPDPFSVAFAFVDDFVEYGTPSRIELSATSASSKPIVVSANSDLDGDLGTQTPTSEGLVVFEPTLSPGVHAIDLVATQGSDVIDLSTEAQVCVWPELEPFDSGASIEGWTTFGDASWDPHGWLEITGNASGRAGAIFKTDSKVNRGNVAMEFSIATGGGINTGADGFAVSVIDAEDEIELATIVNAAGTGGCLGYGVAGGCGDMVINAFHIEFDTWYNAEYEDPTPNNHVAIALNGDPRPYAFAEVASLEDLVWREIRVEIENSDIEVLMDGVPIIFTTIPGFSFDGGYIGVSGSTGWATNFHRFDNLQLYDLCRVPELGDTGTGP